MHRALVLALVTASALTTAACTSEGEATAPAMSVTTTAPPATAAPAPATTDAPADGSGGVAAPGSCHVRGSGLLVLPDPACTPGATDPAVTPATVAATICRSGWTATVRPPESYTEPIKVAQMVAYGETGSPGGYEEDHLIPLELGGSPTAPDNLWPEPGASPNPKDEVEAAANRAVCDGRMPLATAQQAMARDWITLGRTLDVGATASGG